MTARGIFSGKAFFGKRIFGRGKKSLRRKEVFSGRQSGRFPGRIVAAAHPDRESVMLGNICGICGMLRETGRDITNLTGWRSLPFGLQQLLLR